MLALLTVLSAGALMVAQSVVLPMVLMFVVDGVAGVVDGVAGCWRSIVVSLIAWHVASWRSCS